MAEESKDWENVDQKAVLGRADGKLASVTIE